MNCDNKLLGICKLCNKRLVPMGTKRSNGKIFLNDWNDRKYHKKCYKLILENQEKGHK